MPIQPRPSLDQWARLRSDWARWAAAQVATWPDRDGPRDQEAVKAILAAVLDGTDDNLLVSSRDRRIARARRSEHLARREDATPNPMDGEPSPESAPT